MDTQEIIAATYARIKSMPNAGDWQGRHLRAFNSNPIAVSKSMPGCVVAMVEAWGRYADAHRKRYGSPIGDDGVLGWSWRTMGVSLRGLLNGETGNLDCGTMDTLICAIAAEHGVNFDE